LTPGLTWAQSESDSSTNAPSRFVIAPDGTIGYATISQFNPATGAWDQHVVSFVPLAAGGDD